MPEPQEIRQQMQQFWEEHSQKANTEEMMLDSDADRLGEKEIPEILSLLPDTKDKRVLELGAGIGRFTALIAPGAKSVLAVDFMQNFIDKNKEENGHLKNITFKQADVMKLELEKESLDVAFSNWLLMYLGDEEVHTLFKHLITWVEEDGFFFFRESCYHQSGNKDRGENPTKYRTPAEYNNLLKSITVPSADGKSSYGFETVLSRSIQSYIELKGNRNQVCWLVQKVKRQGAHGFATFQEFLDNQQYSRNGILRYEKIFGRNYVSTGGKETTEEFVKMLKLQKGQHVLDVGCGIGGSAFLMAQEYGAQVTGIDLSVNMIEIAMERANELKENRVVFEVADATKRKYKDESFDVVYSRDTILHIEDKTSLFSNFYRWLKPGGKVLISDYCCKEGKWSDVYTEYVKQRGYNLLSPSQYGKVLESVGFKNVRAEDRTDMFVDVLKRELERTTSIKDEFIKEFSKNDYDSIVTGWEDKLHRCGLGDQKWGLFYAEKPTQ